ncbi:hypothetical protein ABEB36_000471 [Hypothenemus hampei]|uniref:Uncharacterized protein n=1 Tax=Hypothenemus hampei TaxID=57062 RepID=A0ABD1FBB7_HYPHA
MLMPFQLATKIVENEVHKFEVFNENEEYNFIEERHQQFEQKRNEQLCQSKIGTDSPYKRIEKYKYVCNCKKHPRAIKTLESESDDESDDDHAILETESTQIPMIPSSRNGNNSDKFINSIKDTTKRKSEINPMQNEGNNTLAESSSFKSVFSESRHVLR